MLSGIWVDYLLINLIVLRLILVCRAKFVIITRVRSAIKTTMNFFEILSVSNFLM